MLHRVLYRKLLLPLKCKQNNYNFVRQGGHAPNYRVAPESHSKATTIGAEVVSTLMWWWVLWHLWHEPGHIVGEFKYPDSSEWSNKELGIPPY